MLPLIGLVVASPQSEGVHPDLEIDTIASALERAGLVPVVVPWTAATAWDDFDALVLKSPWDYSMRSVEFLGWLRRVEAKTTVLNHPKTVRWNFDKRYLSALAEAGVNSTNFNIARSKSEARRLLSELRSPRVVVKPTVSAGSRNTGLFDAGDDAAIELVGDILEHRKTPMILPALDSVESDGENGLIFFGGTFSHAGHKAPILARGGSYLHGRYTETVTAANPPPEEVLLGTKCLAVIGDVMRRAGLNQKLATPLYARIDIARDHDGAPCVIEAELFEPNYFTHLNDRAADRFAMALAKFFD